jgi:hypothetical protein
MTRMQVLRRQAYTGLAVVALINIAHSIASSRCINYTALQLHYDSLCEVRALAHQRLGYSTQHNQYDMYDNKMSLMT